MTIFSTPPRNAPSSKMAEVSSRTLPASRIGGMERVGVAAPRARKSCGAMLLRFRPSRLRGARMGGRGGMARWGGMVREGWFRDGLGREKRPSSASGGGTARGRPRARVAGATRRATPSRTIPEAAIWRPRTRAGRARARAVDATPRASPAASRHERIRWGGYNATDDPRGDGERARTVV